MRELKSETREVPGRDGPFRYTLLRKRIKNMYLRVTEDGEVLVTANPLIPKKTADAFVQKNENYIRKHKKAQETERARAGQAAFSPEDRVLFGRKLPVRILYQPVFRDHADFQEDGIYLWTRTPDDPEKVRKLYEKGLLDYTKRELQAMTDFFRPLFKGYEIPDPKIVYRTMSSRWGSCRAAKREITLNTRLAFYPREAAEYVVVHELAHFVYPDHQPHFWAVVASVLPDWKKRRKLLNG